MTKRISSEQDTVQKQPVEGSIFSNQEQLLHHTVSQQNGKKNHQFALATGSLLLFTLSLITFNQASSTDFLLKKGSQGTEVSHLQQRLKAAGYWSGRITENYDQATENAVKTFQKDQGIEANGKVDENTNSVLINKVQKKSLSSRYLDHKVETLNPIDERLNAELKLQKRIKGDLAPKSVVYSGNGLFFVQNMMYEHSINVYDREFNLIKKIKDEVKLKDYGYPHFKDNQYQGSPVEAAFSPDGKSAYVSNYEMFGSEFTNPGYDTCEPSDQFDPSFIYKINTETLEIKTVIKVGSVPKYVAVSPNNRWVLVSNWCSGDLSVIDSQSNQEIKRIPLGQFPRGIAIDPNSKIAYIAVMGTSDLAVVNLEDYSVNWIYNVGLYPRHLVLDSTGKYLYVTLNGDDHVAKIETKTGEIISKIFTGSAPRSMVLSPDNQYLYIVNYYSNTVSKVRTETMELIDNITVDLNPIGITFDPETHQIWVACYTGSLMVLQDQF
ncbi:peptidoglycan-binding protein [Planktothrix mougeotii]|uniref:Peptidoglycan-binding protein n=1 Tax=Planktothrix mougeotii LEGE 06226 TaxID=1828728 RepID=A0ABR9UDF3_9CYAN|nr:peptidoglycan-binding protein [Planktothrix mougeotii]MBE9144485.1 peptidoglycan-binding protein [Planktothrix mougeotii LEGE 06226]